MDWQALRELARSDDVSDKYTMDSCLLSFIPDRPNDPADAEWLDKRSGWLKWDMWWFKGSIGFDENYTDGHTEMAIRGDGGSLRIMNPTRMQVALFELALEAGVKHE